MSNTGIHTILRSPQSVFTFTELALLLGISHENTLAAKIHYYVKTGALYAIRKGLYAKDKNYHSFELAIRIYTPAYISFETVLAQEGVIFQAYQPIFVASYLTRELKCDEKKIAFKKIKSSVLTNNSGVYRRDYYFMADKERAFLDTIYLHKDYYFDHLNRIDWDKCFERIHLYENKKMEKRLNKYYRENKNA
ncbi:MAG: hypothetical protein A3C44_06465 [Gammaproteobacteria bacterium RIFCSPHIGHO2_02_FULL_39_13]|nr:MAG: hypothetical protein A3C44_06465 [Gammaproteobacteria bacterium RIFCSPHIGHO2_02_FULL_39_13]OGT49750.1 MAG: hypothetical protein A3E53_04605 [Gammaproteobacteria bacterium RIFCSPHIGHO2_12_FULL_39_24]